MSPVLTAALLIVGLAVFAFTMLRRIAPLGALRREVRIDRMGERIRRLLAFGFGQKRLVDPEERVPGVLHVLIFAAFLVLALRTITLFGMGFSETFHLPFLSDQSTLGRAYLFVKDVVVLGALVGVAGFLWRRLVTKPDRVTLSREGVVILLFIAGLMVTEMAFDGAQHVVALGRAPRGIVYLAEGVRAPDRPVYDLLAPARSLAVLAYASAGVKAGTLSLDTVALVGAISLWLHLALILVFLNVLPYGKHFHIITALPNVLFARLPPAAALRKLDLEAEDVSFGAATVKDLSWKEAWDVYSCTECGRCQTHCPTYVTGKPLSHKEVNRAIRHHLADVAPVLIENVPRLIDMRRHDVLVESAFPEEAARVFKGIETQGNPWGIGSNRRADWCSDLAIPRPGDGPFEWLFFVGCAGAFDDRQKKVSRAIVRILREAKVSFAILGEEETCTGDAARRLGNEYLFQMQAQALVELLNGHGVTKILVQCPHCLNTLANELPQFGGKYEVVHHADLVARLVRDGKLSPGKAEGLGEVTFHDPCYLARWNGITEPPRDALRSAGAEVKEMARKRRQGFCCGAGSGRFWLEEKLGTRVNRNRADEAVATLGPQGGTVATACPFCLTMMKDGLADAGKEETVRVLDVAEIVALGLPARGG